MPSILWMGAPSAIGREQTQTNDRLRPQAYICQTTMKDWFAQIPSVVDRALRISFVAAANMFPPISSAHAQASSALECPPVLATKVLAEKHPGWSIYDNDPLRLTGADIEYAVDNEDATLNPDEVRELNDANLSIVQVFRLKAHRRAKHPSLVCHYGVHAQLSRTIPQQAAECTVIQRRQFGPEQFEFEASCR